MSSPAFPPAFEEPVSSAGKGGRRLVLILGVPTAFGPLAADKASPVL